MNGDFDFEPIRPWEFINEQSGVTLILNRRQLFIFIWVIVCSFVSASKDPYEKIFILLDNNEIKKAESLIQDLLKHKISDLDAHRLKAALCVARGELPRAIQEIDCCIKLAQKGSSIKLGKLYMVKGNYLVKSGDLKAAIFFLKQAYKLSPHDHDVVFSLFSCYLDMKNPQAAEALFKNTFMAAEKDEGYSKEILNWISYLGDCYADNHRKQDAARVWRELIAQDPANGKYHVEFANNLVYWGLCQEGWFESRVAFMLTGNMQIKSMLDNDLPGFLPEPPGNLQRSLDYVKKVKLDAANKSARSKEKDGGSD